MTDDRNERINRRAYEIWEREGRPDGQHDEHWRRAAEEVGREDAAKSAKPAKAADTPAKRTQGAEGKGDPRKTVAEHAPGEKAKSASGRTAGAATKQQGPGNAPADPRAAKAAERAPGEANPKPRKSDAAVKASNDRSVRR
jgi:hypothetical protein